MTRIDPCAVFPSEPLPQAGPAVTGPGDLPALLTALDQAGADGPVIAVVPSWGPRRLRETFETARMLVGRTRLHLLETALPPLAASAAAGALAGLARRVPPDVAPLLFPAIQRHVRTLAWLPSVANLARGDVGLSLHLRSYITRQGFVVHGWPRVTIAPVPRAGPLRLDLPPGACVLIADRDGDAGWRSQHLLPAVDGTAVVEVPPTTEGPAWWGARRLTEVAVIDGDLDALTAAVSGEIPMVDCPWCGAATTGDCLRCGAGTGQLLEQEAP